MHIISDFETGIVMSTSITLHVGASKCGSSALQTALSASPTITRHDGTKLNYAVLDEKTGEIIDKERLIASRGIFGYRVSPNAKLLVGGPLDNIRKQIRSYPTDLILSCESWLYHPEQWKEILDFLDVDVDVVVYVRPQVQVLNSAWWQWGAWADQDFDDWMTNRLNASLWGFRAQKWTDLSRVKRLMVKPVSGDIVADFYENVIGAPLPVDAARSNPSLPGPLLRLFQRNRSLRPSFHSSRIDFALSDQVGLSDPSIWVLNEEWIDRILKKTQKDNELLISLMDESGARHVREDPHWWSSSAYSEKTAEPPGPQAIPPEKLEEMCVAMARSIYRLRVDK